MNWTFFDKIYCINLYTNPERYENAKKIFENLNMNVEFYRTNPSKYGGQQGCFESHINIIKDAAKNNYDNIIIFEDDIVPNNIDQKKVDIIINFIKKNKYDIFYLGICPDLFINDSKIIDRKNKIYKARPSLAHAYIVNKNTINRLKDVKFSNSPIDTYYANIFNNNYAIYPSLFYQSNMGSFSKIPEFLRPTKYNTFLEGYAYNFGVSLMKIIIFLFAIILLSYIFNLKIAIAILIIILLIIFQTLYKNILE